MKKVLAIVALVAAMFVAGKVQAQTTIYATYAPESFISSYNNSNSSKVNYQGFSVGVNHNITLYKGFGVAPGLQFRMNMNTSSYEQTVMGITGKFNVKKTQTILDVPVLFNYDLDLTRVLSIVPFVGPMASFALSGVTLTECSDPIFGNSIYTSNWYGEDAIMKRFNLYALVGADIKFKGFNVFGGYRWGLLDIDTNDQTTMKTRGMFVGLGYSF